MPTAQRYSRKREAILQTLMSTTSHPSAEWIYLQLKGQYPDLSLGTVYRNLSQFKQQGSIVCVGTVDGVERFDGTVRPHSHFICNGCGQVLDLHELQIPDDLCQRASVQTGGIAESCWLTLYGRCFNCKKH